MSPGMAVQPPAPATSPVVRFAQNLAAADAKTAGAMLLNFLSSTCIVVFNKLVYDKFGFKYAVTLTCFHLWCTFFLLLLASRMGVFEIKRLPLGPVTKLAAGTMGFICLTNLSLAYNSVGFYQVMKVMTTPTVVIIEALFYQKYLAKALKISLIPVCLGVILTAALDFRLNMIGSIYAILGVIVTSFYQIWSGTLQKSLDCNALQLQTYVSPVAGTLILAFIPILDNYNSSDPKSILNYEFNAENMSMIAVTGFFGFLVNISIFLVIGRSSALSYNILGHCKTVVVLASDFILFSRPFEFKSTAGILLTMIGVFWYTSLKLEKARLEKEARERNAVNELTIRTDYGDQEKKSLVMNEVREK